MNYAELIGAVVIGRNEGERLIVCLKSLNKSTSHIIYVDSGSTDNSLSAAKSLGVETLSLDMCIPFTAARARNEGARYLSQKYPNLKYIQFVDGDCELQPDWLAVGSAFLEINKKYAVACGHCRERFPGQSIYNQLCDIEWDTPVGDVDACGGIALVRLKAYQQINGFRDDLIAGEEPEMCFRLRQKGWMIRRIDAEMVLHDAAITQFSQWWKRTVRSGYAFALGSSIHGKSEERYWVKECRRIYLWGLLLPSSIVVFILLKPIFYLLFLIYPLQIIRLGWKRPDIKNVRFLWAASIVLGKIPEAVGLIRFWSDKARNSTSRIIEYK